MKREDENADNKSKTSKQISKERLRKYRENRNLYTEMKFEFVYNSMTATDISKKYNIPKEDLNKLMQNDNWLFYRQLLNEKKDKMWFTELQDFYIDSHLKLNKQSYEAWQEVLDVTLDILKDAKEDTKKITPRYMTDIATVIEKAQAGTMTSNKMLTRMEEEDLKYKYAKLELEKMKLNSEGINAPEGTTLEDIMEQALSKYVTAKDEQIKEHTEVTYEQLREQTKQNSQKINPGVDKDTLRKKSNLQKERWRSGKTEQPKK